MPRFAANLTMLFREHPLPARFQAARAAGFAGVEVLTTEGVATEDLRRAAEDAGLPVVLFNAPMGDFPQGGAGLSAVPGREAEFRAAIEDVRDLARALGCPNVHAGPSRVPDGLERSTCLATYRANLAVAADLLNSADIRLTIEPLNTQDMPGVLLFDPDEALEILDGLSGADAALQFDIYHMTRNGQDVPALLRRLAGRIGHIQFADTPGRHEPGTGKVDFETLFRLIDETGYTGWVSAEYNPSAETEKTLGWLGAS